MESTHTEAMKYDGEKVRLDLLPADPIIDVGKVLTYGAKKYSERNWERGLAWSRCYGATLRHLLAWHKGETNDPETGLNHLAHAACEILFLLEFSRTHPELDDRPNTPEVGQPETYLDVVRMTMPDVKCVGDGCPWAKKFSDAFAAAGYLQPSDACPCDDEDGHAVSCEACWSRPAAKLKPVKAVMSETEKPAGAPSPDPERRPWTELVKEFNETFDNFIKRETGKVPTLAWYESLKTQLRLIYEEIDELGVAYKQWDSGETDDEIPILDAICDSIYVLIGLALKMGFNLDGAFREVHRSNMSKLDKDGKPIKRADGKVLKGPNFTPPKLDAYI